MAKDGGPAFGHGDPTHGGDPGMSLRDWFAGQALAGLLAKDHPHYHGPEGFDIAAQDAWLQADAMLAAREADDA